MSADGAPAWLGELAAALGVAWDGPVRAAGARRLSGGASRHTWSVDLAAAPPGRPLGVVVQLERPGALGASSGGLDGEAELLRAAAAAGVPVPAVLLGDVPGATRLAGAPALVTERVPGETLPRRLLRDDAHAAARLVLARQAGRALAQVHRVPPGAVPRLVPVDPLRQAADLLGPLGLERPTLVWAVRELERSRPPATGDVVVHGDFRLGNLVVDADGLAAVLDWELAHLGDPAEDLGWFCARAWRFSAPQEAGGVGSLDDLLAGYREGGGVEVPPDAVRWWEAVAALRWAVICGVQLAAHLGGASRSVELAAIGRRVAECEEDLLELLAGPSDYEPPATAAGPPWPVDLRPSADELLEAVGEHLSRSMQDLEGRAAYEARVAANVVALVRRELGLGAAVADAHRARLAALGVDDDASLVAALRAGRLDGRRDELTAALRASVRDQLAVSHPGYWRPDGSVDTRGDPT